MPKFFILDEKKPGPIKCLAGRLFCDAAGRHLKKPGLVLTWAVCQIVGWVERSLDVVGFRYTLPNLRYSRSLVLNAKPNTGRCWNRTRNIKPQRAEDSVSYETGNWKLETRNLKLDTRYVNAEPENHRQMTEGRGQHLNSFAPAINYPHTFIPVKQRVSKYKRHILCTCHAGLDKPAPAGSWPGGIQQNK